MQSILSLLTAKPDALLTHAQAYAILAQAELGEYRRRLVLKFVLFVGAFCSASLAIVFAGFALLLSATLKIESTPTVYFTLPTAFGTVSAAGFLLAWQLGRAPASEIPRQLASDIAHLKRLAGASA